MKSKIERWYEVEGNTAFIYDAPFADKQEALDALPVKELPFYRSNFSLRKATETVKPFPHLNMYLH